MRQIAFCYNSEAACCGCQARSTPAYSRMPVLLEGVSPANSDVWYHYSDRAIRTELQFFRAINYLHANPARHGYVQHSREWRWSSLSRYLETVGAAWLVDTWRRFPIEDFGAGWDDACEEH